MGFSSKNWYQSWYQAFVQKYQYRYQYRIFQLFSISISIGIRLAAKDSISIVSVSKIQTCLVSVSYRYRKKWYRRSLVLSTSQVGVVPQTPIFPAFFADDNISFAWFITVFFSLVVALVQQPHQLSQFNRIRQMALDKCQSRRKKRNGPAISNILRPENISLLLHLVLVISCLRTIIIQKRHGMSVIES